MRKTLFLGAGGKTKKLISFPFLPEEEEEIITLDIQLPADIIFDLGSLHRKLNITSLERPGRLPFEDESLTEIHAYEVLEHFGKQGDWKGFFAEWTEYHRVLKEGGLFALTVPIAEGIQQWGDPGHCRALNKITFSYLSQHVYLNRAEGDPRTDYRSVWKGNMVKIHEEVNEEAARYALALQKQPVIDYNRFTNGEKPPVG